MTFYFSFQFSTLQILKNLYLLNQSLFLHACGLKNQKEKVVLDGILNLLSLSHFWCLYILFFGWGGGHLKLILELLNFLVKWAAKVSYEKTKKTSLVFISIQLNLRREIVKSQKSNAAIFNMHACKLGYCNKHMIFCRLMKSC